MKKITIIGAGNGGVTASYHFSREGHDVCLYDNRDFSVQIDAIKKNKGIRALESRHETAMFIHGFEKIKLATNSIEEAIEFSNYLFMIVPSFAQEIMFRAMLPYLTDKHTLISMPGNYASLVLDKIKKEEGYDDLDLTYVDTMTIPWACRLFNPGEVGVMGIKQFIYAGVYPHSRTESTLSNINKFFPIPVSPLENVIASGLENINFGGHPLITTLNMGLLENFKGRFNYYSDCISPATDRVSTKMESERQKIGKGLNLRLKSELDMMNFLYNSNAGSVYEFNKTSVTHGKIHSAPDSSYSRYITEDVPNILVPCFGFAKLLGIKVPIIESCIHIASAFNGTDYFNEGRTLEKMGLGNMTKDQILEAVNG